MPFYISLCHDDLLILMVYHGFRPFSFYTHCQVDWEKTLIIFYILLECFFCRWVDTTGKCRRARSAFEAPLYSLRAPEPVSSSVWTLLEAMLKSSGSVNTKQKANLRMQLLVSLSVLVTQSYNQSFNIHKFYKYSNFDHFIQWILNDMIKHFSMKNLFIWALAFISTRHITWIRANKISIRYVWTWKLFNPQRKICGFKNFGTPVDVAL